MWQLATAWAEAYHKVKPEVFINMNGDGPGTGLAALANGFCDLALLGRKIRPDEAERIKSGSW
jgi:phosphate transport system substrate-binding protein